MPIVTVGRDAFFEALGRKYTDEKFDALCFDFGIELDDVTSDEMMADKEKGRKVKKLSEYKDIVYKIDIPANRYDLLCLESLVRALRVFLGLDAPRAYRSTTPAAPLELRVRADCARVRPVCVAAVLRNITFDQRRYDSFIALQDKLHQNICRKRSLVAIGTHDLDTIEAPFSYEALAPDDIAFVALDQTERRTAREMMEFYKVGHLKAYLDIIRDSPVYPVIFDAQRRVLSMPPIINGDHSKIKLTTKNVLIECTATDATKAHIVLAIMCTAFSQYCEPADVVEQVRVVYDNDARPSELTPDLTPRTMRVSADYINSIIGLETPLPAERIAELATKMQLSAKVLDAAAGDAASDAGVAAQSRELEFTVPAYRSDVMQRCDVAEDIAIAHGYNNVPRVMPATASAGVQLPMNKLTDQLRIELAAYGYSEVLTLALCSTDENYKQLGRVDPGDECVRLANPQTREFQVVRTSLLPGLLKSVRENKTCPLPIDLFELSDVVRRDPASEVGASNERHLIALHADTTSGFELVHGMLCRLARVLNVAVVDEERGVDIATGKKVPGGGLSLRASEHATYLAGRQGDIFFAGKRIGELGVVAPQVLAAFELDTPVSVFELSIEPFL